MVKVCVYLSNVSDNRHHLVKLKMSLETCPFCGKPFKRLKSHLPHCKMAPGSKTAKRPKEIPAVTFKHTSNKDKTNKVNTDTKLNYPTSQANSISPVKSEKVEKVSVDKEFLQNMSFTLPSTSSKVPSAEAMDTDTLKPKIKWLAKREQEMLKRAKLQTQTRIEFDSVSQQEKHNSKTYKNPITDAPLLEKEIPGGQKGLTETSLTSQLITSTATDPLQRVPWTTDCQVKQSMQECKENTCVSEQIQNSPKPLTKELGSRVNEQVVTVFQTKTCVWDHIKHALYEGRHDRVPVLFPIVSAHKVSFTKYVNTSECVLSSHTGNDQNATMKACPIQLPISQTSVQKSVEDVLSSRLQNMSVMAYSPEMATGYGETFFFSSHSEISSNENVLMKCQTSKFSPQSQGLMTERRLGDVKLKELFSWLGARTPKSPKETVTMFNKGWQWYYRKYIDVQKGGIGGIAMLIGGYCVLSYIWSYSHIKKQRWRTYH
ncbi:uncharacterized protein si:dkey-21c1.4 isoform X2 [Neoarius graeffei]|uniref:uncharacterized protein si:dkey-21c1.4 isoform X2 n=1 Tax=Neoarius graeffei TaxID=443677 RepID=UPI00298C76C3|nr:uncharacterized protein si:dkey-21c1.4 isoform X2 [Neoarius graeffei]